MRILLLFLLFISISSVSASPYAVFRAGSHTDVDLCDGDPANAINGDIWIAFTPTDGDMVIQHYDYTGTTLVYAYTPPTIVVKDVKAFETAIFHDETIPLLTRYEIAKLFPLLESNVDNDGDRIAFWAVTKSLYNVSGGYLYGNCTDSVPITQKIADYGVTFNVPLE